MSRKLVAVAMVAVWAGWPAAASACDFPFAYHLLGVPESGVGIGAGIGISPLNGDDDAFLTPTVGVGFRLGDRAAIAPLLGYCKGTGDSDDFGEVMFGGGAIFNLWNSDDGMTTFNVQTHAAYTSFGDDESFLALPVMAVVGHALSEGVMIYGEGGIVFDRFSFSGDSETDQNAAFAGGLAFGAGEFNIVTGLTFLFTDSDNDLGLVAAISTGVG